MRLAVLGVGGAGGRIAAALQDVETEDRPFLTGVRALDTDESALAELSLAESQCHGFGYSATGGDGTGGDRTVGGDAAETDRQELRRVTDESISSHTDAILIVTGVGGGTGAAAAPALAETIQGVYELPVYAVSVLPTAGSEAQTVSNAIGGMDALAAAVETQLLFDNDAWFDADTAEVDADLEARRASVNRKIAESVEALFAAGEARRRDAVGERTVDAREIINTLEGGPYATIAYAAETVRDPPSMIQQYLLDAPWPALDRFVSYGDDPVAKLDAIKTIETTARRARLDGRWAAVDPVDTARALAVFGGPPEWLHRKAIENARSWLFEGFDGVDVRSGDAPRPYGTDVFVAVLTAGTGRPERFESGDANDRTGESSGGRSREVMDA